MNSLQLFYLNEGEREAVREFFMATLKEMAVERVFEKQTVSGVYEAKKIISKAFDKLDELYGIKTPPVEGNSR